MKIMFYCQHVLGIGHLFRVLEICKAFSGQDVFLVSGGEAVSVVLPHHIRMIRLPGIMMDSAFKATSAVDSNMSLEQIKVLRRDRLLEAFHDIDPDLLLVELYPFGRKAFRFELDPLLDVIRAQSPQRCQVVCSLRDILVEKKDQEAYEARVLAMLNSRFDALLVHADPSIITLAETFSRVDEISVPVVHTGYVAAEVPAGARLTQRRRLGLGEDDLLIVASAGGGKVGAPLMDAVVAAFELLEKAGGVQLYLFTGPFLEAPRFEWLRKQADAHLHVHRFASDFPSFLAAADLSVSMAGYNTCMNIMATGVPALVWPFNQNREQLMRARRLDASGALSVLAPEDLIPSRLATRMTQMLTQVRRCHCSIDLNGAENSVVWLMRWLEGGMDSSSPLLGGS